jgi:hypothetical protein
MGANTVYLIVTDLIGNKDSAIATITIADSTKPTIVTKAHTAYLNAAGNPNGVFVIKVNGAFSTSTYSKVILINERVKYCKSVITP